PRSGRTSPLPGSGPAPGAPSRAHAPGSTGPQPVAHRPTCRHPPAPSSASEDPSRPSRHRAEPSAPPPAPPSRRRPGCHRSRTRRPRHPARPRGPRLPCAGPFEQGFLPIAGNRATRRGKPEESGRTRHGAERGQDVPRVRGARLLAGLLILLQEARHLRRLLVVAEVRHHHAVTMVMEAAPDRKSTRLNSSHVKISYAVF